MLRLFFNMLIIRFLRAFSSVIFLYSMLVWSDNAIPKLKKDTIQDPKSYIEKADWLLRVDQEKALERFEFGERYFEQKKDTLWYLYCRLGLAEIQKRKGHYHDAFQTLWTTLSAAEKFEDPTTLVKLNRVLGVLYGFYGKGDTSLAYLKKGLEIAKQHKVRTQLPGSYLAIARQYISLEQLSLAEHYLDSSYLAAPTHKRLIYADTYYAYIYTKRNALRKAAICFKGLIPQFEKDSASFLPIVYKYYAEYKEACKEKDSALLYYKKSLEAINQKQAHLEIKPSILQRLADLALFDGYSTEAYYYLKSSKAVSDSLFNALSKRNKALFDITNTYQDALTKKEKELKVQQHLQDLKTKSNLRLKIIIGVLALLSLTSLVIYRLRSQVKTMAYHEEKNKTVIETKNKELTENALKIIENEHVVSELLDVIQHHVPQKFKVLQNKNKKQHKKMWNDFHLRFTQTNNGFYKALLERHPALTPNDLKHCALIKLKFDSKEMAHILGISLHSVHVARSRIRKKLGLNRADSLSTYLYHI